MWRMADFMRTPNLAALAGWEKGTPGVMMIAPIVARRMAELGWTQQSIREFLWENSKIPMEQMKRAGAPAWIEIDANPVTRESINLDPWPICHEAGQHRARRRRRRAPDAQLLAAGAFARP